MSSRRPTGRDLVSSWAHDHPRRAVCPGCEQDCSRVGLNALVYTFEPCQCPAAPAPCSAHLMEQIWHRRCLTESASGTA